MVRITGIDAGYSRVGEGEVSGVAAAVLKHFAEVVASLPPKIIRDINAAIGPDSQARGSSARILTNDEERFLTDHWRAGARRCAAVAAAAAAAAAAGAAAALAAAAGAAAVASPRRRRRSRRRASWASALTGARRIPA